MIYGVILNDAASLEKIGPLHDAPYKGAPKAPALYIKPANTRVASGVQIHLPAGAWTVEIAATVGLVMGSAASRLESDKALAVVGGVVLACDLSLPHDSYYRPAIREKCFDGSLVLGAERSCIDLAGVTLDTEINGQLVERRSLTDLIRSPAQLLADVTEFMTLNRGDVLLVGVSYRAPQAAVGSQVRVSADRLGSVEFSISRGETQ